MPNLTNEVAYNTFIKGIITEAGPLTFPENASLDELNFVLQRDGSRKKRLGMDYEDNYVLKSTGFVASQVSGSEVSFHRWDYPQGNLEVSLGIVRVYNTLWFVNLLASSPSTEFKNSGNGLVITGLANGKIETAYINNEIVIVGEDLPYPVKLSYDSDTDTVSQTILYLQIRDFFGVDDGLEISDRPTTLSDEHHYNLKNQGWNDNIQVKGYDDTSDGEGANAAIAYTYSQKGWYPSNADIWYYGRHENPNKKTFGYYVPNELAKNSLNNSQAPQGSYIIDFKNRGESRSEASGINVSAADTEQGNLTCVTAFAGRLFYSGITSRVADGDKNSPNYSGYIFFTPTLFNNDKLDQCYQEADPTGEKVSDLIATDGGAIVIPEMIRVVRMVALQDVLIVFAENGIWAIAGGDSGFRATEYQIKKISDSGTAFPRTIVPAEGSIYYWSNTGIHKVGFGQSEGSSGLSSANISLMTIQTLYNTFSQNVRENSIGIYEEKNSRIRWLINNTLEYDGLSYRNKYNYELIYDVGLEAFYPLELNFGGTSAPYIAGYIQRPNYSSTNVSSNVVVNGVQVQENTVDVIQTSVVYSPESAEQSYLVMINVGGTFYFTFAQYNNEAFLDWQSYDTVGTDYDCYLVTGYEVFKDAMRVKGIPYLYVYCIQTEESFTTNGDDFDLVNQSSCLVQAQWGWTNSAIAGKWGTQFQAYRLKRDFIPTVDGGSLTNGEYVVVTKNKLRGSGKALSLYIQAETGKNLHLLGWAVFMTATQRPI